MIFSRYTCRICNAVGDHLAFLGREMMFGTREEFEYFQCNTCNCLQISDIPKNLGIYYLSDYTAHTLPKITNKGKNWLVSILQKQRCRTALFNKHHKLNSLLKQFIDFPSELHGVCLIRIPIVPSLVCEKYGTNWIEFVPPRHLYLHSVKSLTLLANKVGLEIFDVQYDTTPFEFYGSEMYARGIHLTDENSPWVNTNSSLFTKEEMDGFKALANQVNQTGQSGRVGLFLRRAI